jgi:hypothetical protein
MTIITLITLFATLTAPTVKLGDVCNLVHTNTGTPVLCEPHPDGAPRYDGTVCCNGDTCIKGDAGTCLADRKPYYCELGQLWASGEVSCYFEVPAYCDVFPCAPSFQTWPQANDMCCHDGECWTPNTELSDCEIEDIYWCDDGVTNQDGTVTCFD